MRLFGWFDTTQSDAFAREIGDEFLRNFPVAAGARSEQERARKLQAAVDQLGNRATRYHREKPLGWYRRARFIQTVRTHIEQQGHSVELANDVAYKLVLRLSQARRQLASSPVR
jgi:hypothetical protein